jgi:hypothetical protein
MSIQLPVSVRTMRIYRQNLNVYYPAVTGLANPAAQQRINRAIYDTTEQLIEDQGYYQNPQTDMLGYYEIKTNERDILSITLENYAFVGGAHGLTIIRSLTFNVNNGIKYSLGDLFKLGSDYVGVLSDLVAAQIKERDIPLLDGFNGISPDQYYYIADKCLVLYFQLYDITPYAYGFPYFPISVYQIQDIIDEQGPLGKML